MKINEYNQMMKWLTRPKNKFSKVEKKKIVDPCPICSKELHLDSEYTQRIGLLGNHDDGLGWLCPHCNSEFDTDNHIVKVFGGAGMRGEA